MFRRGIAAVENRRRQVRDAREALSKAADEKLSAPRSPRGRDDAGRQWHAVSGRSVRTPSMRIPDARRGRR